jgi:hypothetical protein
MQFYIVDAGRNFAFNKVLFALLNFKPQVKEIKAKSAVLITPKEQ